MPKVTETELSLVKEVAKTDGLDLFQSIRAGIQEANTMLKTAQDTIKMARGLNQYVPGNTPESPKAPKEVKVVEIELKKNTEPTQVHPSAMDKFIETYGDRRIGDLLTLISPLTVKQLIALMQGATEKVTQEVKNNGA